MLSAKCREQRVRSTGCSSLGRSGQQAPPDRPPRSRVPQAQLVQLVPPGRSPLFLVQRDRLVQLGLQVLPVPTVRRDQRGPQARKVLKVRLALQVAASRSKDRSPMSARQRLLAPIPGTCGSTPMVMAGCGTARTGRTSARSVGLSAQPVQLVPLVRQVRPARLERRERPELLVLLAQTQRFLGQRGHRVIRDRQERRVLPVPRVQ